MTSPVGWASTNIGELVDRLQYGYTASASSSEVGPRFLRITDLRDNGVDWNSVPTCVVGVEDLEKYRLFDGDFVFARSGSIEKAWRVCAPPDAVFASYLIRGRPVVADVSPWLEHFLKSLDYLEQIGAAGAGIGMQNVNAKKLANVELPLPPLNEQKRIVAKIEELTARSRRAKEALDAVPPLLDKLRQSILAAAFRGDLTADWRAKNPNPVWRNVALSEIAESIQYGYTASSEHGGESGSKYLRITDIQQGEVNWDSVPVCQIEEKLIGKYRLAPGDIVFARSGATSGKSFLIERCPADAVFASYLIRVRPGPEVDPAYLARYFQSSRYWEYIVDNMAGNAQPNCNGTKLAALPVVLPSLGEQQEIVRRSAILFKSLPTLLDVSRQMTEALGKLDQSILAKAFRGELVPQDPTDEPASVLLDRIRAARQSSAPAKPTRTRKPKASAEASTPKQKPKPEPAQQQLALELTSTVLQAAVFPALWLRGPLDKDTAVRTLAEHLREAGLVEFKRLRADGPLYKQLLAAIESAVKSGELDRPRRGHVRACKHEASAYTPDDWRQVLLASLGAEPVHQEDAIRQAAEWARDNLGLEFSRIKADGHISKGLHAAITSAIRQGLIERDGPRRIKLAGG